MKRQILVVGLGRFGVSVAETLSAVGYEVLAIDKDEQNVQAVSSNIAHAMQADATNEAVLREIGARNFDIAVVAIGSNIESSVLATILLKKIDVPHVIARSNNMLHGEILERIGAEVVVSPENDMGRQLAHRITLPRISGYLHLTSNYGIAEFRIPDGVPVKTISEYGLGQMEKLKIAVLLIKREKEIVVTPANSEAIKPEDVIIISGKDEDLETFFSSF